MLPACQLEDLLRTHDVPAADVDAVIEDLMMCRHADGTQAVLTHLKKLGIAKLGHRLRICAALVAPPATIQKAEQASVAIALEGITLEPNPPASFPAAITPQKPSTEPLDEPLDDDHTTGMPPSVDEAAAAGYTSPAPTLIRALAISPVHVTNRQPAATPASKAASKPVHAPRSRKSPNSGRGRTKPASAQRPMPRVAGAATPGTVGRSRAAPATQPPAAVPIIEHDEADVKGAGAAGANATARAWLVLSVMLAHVERFAPVVHRTSAAARATAHLALVGLPLAIVRLWLWLLVILPARAASRSLQLGIDGGLTWARRWLVRS